MLEVRCIGFEMLLIDKAHYATVRISSMARAQVLSSLRFENTGTRSCRSRTWLSTVFEQLQYSKIGGEVALFLQMF